jgi:SWIM zinc finger
MTISWTPERILALAPDSSSASAGRGLANKKNWGNLGKTDTAIWGECQGSGKNPYQTRIDPLEPAFKCSCPSRKFPCKHGLGLFLLLQSDAGAFTGDTPPAWVTEWLEGRAKRVEAKETKKAEVAADPKAGEKRIAARTKKVSAGLEELSVWLCDLIRTGLSSVQNKPYSFWDGMGARLIDAQAPGAARMVRELAGIASSGEGWAERLLERLGKIHLLCEAYSRIESLPETVQADVRTAIGFTQSQDELLEQAGIVDRWHIIGILEERQDRLRARRAWLRGEKTNQYAMILDFAHGNLPFERILEPASILIGELVFFPSNVPTRALIKKAERDLERVNNKLDGLANFGIMLEQYASAIANQPWLERIPVTISSLVADKIGETWVLRDTSDQIVSLQSNYDNVPNLLAISGGHPIAVFGEFDGQTLLPLMLLSSEGIFAQIHTSEEA